MPKLKKHHHSNELKKESNVPQCQEKVSGMSMFNNTVNVTVKQEQKEDGCTGCFKALFQALKK